MRLIIAMVILFFASVAQAQKKPVYTMSLEGGWLKGNNDASSVYLFSNGISYHSISVGLGTGIDNYLLRSVPLFIALRKDFGHRLFQPFFDYSAGINIDAIKPEQEQVFDFYQNKKVKDGFYTRAMVGASVRLYKKFRFYTGFGYSYKTIRVDYDTYNYLPEQEVSRGSAIYRLKRWSLTAGFRF